ncbi:hypothetical protein XK97_10625 [Obesumbacterium proteus]|uniref:hypothetical protein n=1 Tax=Obesumbacterium proteus TaxID=82983 RepID=UPI00062125B2|nr:hypothetical protein [Obesumbacterium proteus]KKI47265.1 hypothetical protein XK97_10625 [Obesumbacterium proteus]
MQYLLLLVLASAGHAFAADKPNDFNPSDPSIWQEKPLPEVVREKEQLQDLCRTFPDAECPANTDRQPDIQREEQRRKDKSRYKSFEK